MVVSKLIEAHLSALSRVWKVVDVQVLGPFSKCEGFSYLLLIEDKTTTWVDILPIGDATETEISRALFHVFVRFGFPEFNIKGISAHLEMNVKENLQIQYHKVNSNLNKLDNTGINLSQITVDILSKLVKQNPDKWSVLLDELLLKRHYMFLQHPETSSPFSLMFGRQVNVPSAGLNVEDKTELTGVESISVSSSSESGKLTSDRNNGFSGMQCLLCARKFTSKLSLRIHQRKHKPHSIPVVVETTEVPTASVPSEPSPAQSEPTRYSLRTTLKPRGDSGFVRSFLTMSSARRVKQRDTSVRSEVVVNPTEFSSPPTHIDLQLENTVTERDGMLANCSFESVVVEPAERNYKEGLAKIPNQNGEICVEIRLSEDCLPLVNSQEECVVTTSEVDENVAEEKSEIRTAKKYRVQRVKRSSYLARPYKCPRCVATYLSSSEELNIHVDCHIEGEKSFRCISCQKVLCTWAYMLRHLSSHPEVSQRVRTVPQDARTCIHCDKVFSTKEGMLHHVEVLHEGLKRYQCDTCGKQFKELKTFSRHIDLHANVVYSCNKCKYQTKVKKNYREHSRIHEGKGVYCEVCGKAFSKPALLRSHAQTHEEERSQIPCPYCHLKLISQATLKIHVKNKHENSRVFICSLCHYVTKAKGNLLGHMERRHSAKQLQCSECSYNTHLESALTRHQELYHNTERRFLCNDCGYRAHNGRQLVEHTKNRHNPQAGRFPCPHCGAKFKTRTMLRHHLPAHTGQHLYFCQLCSYSAKYRQTVHYHVRVKHPGVSVSSAIKGTRFPRKSEPELPVTDQHDLNEKQVAIISEDILHQQEEIIEGIQLEDGSIVVNGTTLELTEDCQIHILTSAEPANSENNVLIQTLPEQRELAKVVDLLLFAVDSDNNDRLSNDQENNTF